MARSTINISFNFSFKLAIVALVVCTSCNSNRVDGSPIPKLRTDLTTDCRGNPHHCTSYRALLVNVYSEAPTKVVTFRGNEAELKNITRHPISVYNLYHEQSFSLSFSKLRYWKTMGDKYLAVNSNGQLILQEENSTKFLVANATITNDRIETFYVCAIKGGKSYLVTHSKNTEHKHKWTEAVCQSESTFIAKLEEINPDKRKKYVFNGVNIKESNFNSLHITVGDELKLLCDV